MSTVDYNKIYLKAKKRAVKYGRAITFVQLDGAPTNPSRPWLGNSDARATPVATLETHGVFVEPESLERLGKQRQANEFVESAEQVIIVAHNGSLGQFDEVIDTDGSLWKIANKQELAPGDSKIIHYVRVQRRGHVTAVRGALL